MIPKQTIQEVLDTAKIEEVVGDFVNLTKRGVNQIGQCPFHNEKTPSFTVSPTKGIFKCFGCGEAGSSVDFIMKHEHYTFPQAIVWLAKKYNIEVEEQIQTEEQTQADNERENLFAVTQFAANFFTKNLHTTTKGKAIGLSYYNERGFSSHTIEKFQLGYSSDSWDELCQAATKAGYNADYLIKTGLAIAKDDGGMYDRFRDRVIFPIKNVSGRVLGFGGRILTSDKNKPKYVNSPESPIYNKSNVLFGLFEAKNEIIKKDNCFLVEGYTDVISLSQSGIENVVSSSGTSLTTGQIKLIKRYTKNITILYDGDTAGIKASFRGIDMILKEDLNVKVVLFPDGEDPDSFSKKNGEEALSTFLETNALGFINFKANLLSKEAGNDPVKKANVVKEIVETIALVSERLTQSYLIKETSELLDISETTITNEVEKIRRKQNYKTQSKEEYISQESPKKVEQQIINNNSELYYEREIIRLLLNYSDLIFDPKDAKIILEIDDDEIQERSVASFIIAEFDLDEITLEDENFQLIYNEYKKAYQNNTPIVSTYFTHHTDENIRKIASEMLSSQYLISPKWIENKISIPDESDGEIISRACFCCVYSLKSLRINKMITAIFKQIINVDLDETEKIKLMNDYKNLNTVKNKLNTVLGRIIPPNLLD